VGIGALALAACQPIVSAPPPDPCSQAIQQASAEDRYVAVVDDAGPSAPDIVPFRATSEQEKQREVAELEKNGDVISVEPDAPVSAVAVNPGDDPDYGSQYGLQSAPAKGADFPTAWAANFDGSGPVIAIVDSGVTATHEDLAGKVLPGADFVTSSGACAGVDPNGHGTHVAGIAAAADNQVGGLGGAPRAAILPVKVLNAQGSGLNSTVANGIVWATDNGADVINLSLGGTTQSSAMLNAVAWATNHNVVVVAAAGNDGTATTIYPAAYDNQGAIAVASTDQNGNKSSFSNYGASVDVAAPGSGIISTLNNGGYGSKSGTSMATPFVAALTALIQQQCGSLSPFTIRQILQASGTPVPTTSGPNYAFNRIQAGAAIARNCS